MTDESTGEFRKRGGTYRGLVSVVADNALAAIEAAQAQLHRRDKEVCNGDYIHVDSGQYIHTRTGKTLCLVGAQPPNQGDTHHWPQQGDTTWPAQPVGVPEGCRPVKGAAMIRGNVALVQLGTEDEYEGRLYAAAPQGEKP